MAETKLYLNIQEQVEKNKNDIKFMLEEEGTLNKFGIKVIGQEDDVSDMPSVADYKEDHEDWAYGDAYAIGTEAPYTLYILTRANGTHPNDYWFNIGQFPVPGPQGETGEQGPAGHTPQVTVATPVTNTLPAGSSASASVMNVGTADDPQLAFTFGIPKGDKGDTGAKGDPGAFAINGHVNSAALLPDATLVDADTAYAVGSELPYDVYVIMTVGGVQSWLNLGPIINEIADIFNISESYATSGTLSVEQLNAIVNDSNMNYIKVGKRFFYKNDEDSGSTGYYEYISIRYNDSYVLKINTSTGAWEITSQSLLNVAEAQTITGVKTFSGGVKVNSIKDVNNSDRLSLGSTITMNASLVPSANDTRDIGSSSLKMKNGYFAGQVYAENTFNVINASDIVNSTLTQDQYDLITNGKPTRIIGTFRNITNPILYYGGENANFVWGIVVGSSGGLDSSVTSFYITISNKILYLAANTDGYMSLIGLGKVNGKSIPAYPSSTGTFVLKCVDGVLTWVAE